MNPIVLICMVFAAASAAPQYGGQSYSAPATQSYSAPATQSYSAPATQSYSAPATQSYSAPAQSYGSSAPSTQTYSGPNQNYNSQPVTYVTPQVSFSPPQIMYTQPSVTYSQPQNIAVPIQQAPAYQAISSYGGASSGSYGGSSYSAPSVVMGYQSLNSGYVGSSSSGY